MTYMDELLHIRTSMADKLEADVHALASAAKILAQYLRDQERADPSLAPDLLSATIQPQHDVPPRILEARGIVLGKIKDISNLVQQPTDFLQTFATNIQLTVCLKWLLEFQVLACIPPAGNGVALKDVAQLAAVPEPDLLCIVRMISTAGFLREPQLGYVAHTPISAQFIGSKTVRDASIFLAERAAPAAFQMAMQTPQSLGSEKSSKDSSANNQALCHNQQTFQQACQREPRLHRQWSAYVRHMGDEQWGVGDVIPEVLTRLDWSNLGDASIVETCAPSPDLSSRLAGLYPELHFVVQMDESVHQNPVKETQPSDSSLNSQGLCFGSNVNTNRISIQPRLWSATQTIRDAAVYILHVPPAICRTAAPAQPPSKWIQAELRAHLDALRNNSRSTLIISAPAMLPEHGMVAPDVEVAARFRDISLFQLFGRREMEVAELIELVNGVKDEFGGFRVVNHLRARNNVIAALCVKYHPSSTRQTPVVW